MAGVTYTVSNAKLPIVPDLTGFHRKVKQVLRSERIEAPVIVVPDLTRYAQKLETQLGRIRAEMSVNVTPDLSGFRRSLREQTRDLPGLTMSVDLDLTRAREQIRILRIEAGRDLRVDLDLDITGALARIAAVRAAASGIGGGSLGGLGGGLGSATGGARGLTSALGAAKIGLVGLAAVNLVPLVGQLAQAAGIISLLPAAATAAAASLATIIIGSTGVLDAFTAGSKASEDAAKDAATAQKAAASAAKGVESAQRGVASAAKGVEKAQDGVARAERGVQDAQKASLRAQQSLTDARKDATEQIEDLNLALKGSSLDERDAELSLKRAEQRLRELGKDGQPVTSLDFEEAYLGVDQAKQRIDEVRERNADLREETEAANKAGVDGSAQVVDAQEAVAEADLRVIDSKAAVVDANEGVAEAQANLIDSQQALVDAQNVVAESSSAAATSADKYADALANLSPSARRFVEETRDLGGAWGDLRLQVQENLFAGMGGSITDLANNYLPILKNGLGGIATEINGGLRRAIEDLNTESTKLDWSNILDNTRAAIGPFMDGLSSLAGALTNIASIGSDFLPGGAESFKETMQGFEDWTESEEGQKRIKTFMEDSIRALREIKDLFMAIGGVISGLFTSSEESGKSMVQSMTDSLNEWADWLKSEAGQVRMKQFFDDARTTATTLLNLTGEAIKFADKVMTLLNHPKWGLLTGGSDPATPAPVLDPQGNDGGQTGYGTKDNPNDPNDPFKDGHTTNGVPMLPGGFDDSPGGKFVNGAKEKLQSIADFFSGDAWGWLNPKDGESPFSAAMRQAGDAVERLKDRVKEMALGFLTDIGATAVDAWNALSTKVSEVVGWISGKIDTAKGKVVELKDNAVEWLANIGGSWDGLGSTISNVIGNIVDTLFPGLSTGLSNVRDFFGTVVDGIGRKWAELKDLAATPINWIIDTVINGTLKNAWNAVAAVIPGLKTWDGVARIETAEAGRGGDQKQAIPKFARGGIPEIMPGYTPGRDPYTIGVSGGEAIMRPEWQRAMGPGYIHEANKVARTQGVQGVRAMQRDANFAFGGVVDESLWNAASAAFPNATLNSAYRPGHSGYHGKGGAVDLGGPMQQIADWIYKTYPGSAQLIYGPGPVIAEGNTDQGYARNYFRDDLAGHYDHVHWASNSPIASDGVMVSEDGGGGFIGGVKNFLGGAVESARGLAARTFEKAAGAIGSNIPDFGPSLVGQLPRNVFDGVKNAMSEAIRGKANSGGSGPGSAFEPSAGAEQWRQMMIDAYKNQGYEPTPEKIDAWVRQIDTESGGDPNIAQQITDANGTGEAAGVGLGQMIPTTWQSYRDPNLPDNRRDAWAMTNAMVRYGEQKFGDGLLGMIGQGHGYDSGGIFKNNTIGWNTSGKPEAVLTNDQWKLFDGFNKNLGNFATGGVVDPNEYLRNRLSKYGSDVAGIAKSAIPEILGISGTPLDLTNNRYIDAAMQIGTAVQGGVQSATAADYGASQPPKMSRGVDSALVDDVVNAVIRSGAGGENHFHVVDIDEALRKHTLNQQRQALTFQRR